ncbi:endonuclease/exonuclease/phosphatase family protein [Aestuariivirga sp.]|uniref:endonuclease/exonuclease/phosphatase family protein n=1 Tax=Aestuariivirga sp. TaxID=2650926 RepID=UPI003593593E
MSRSADRQAQVQDQPDGEQPKKKRRPTGSLECKIGILLGLGGLVGSRLGQLWVAFDVFSQFTLQFALVALAFLIGLLMPRAKLFSALVLIVVGLIAIGVWPHVASRTPSTLGSAGPGERDLRVASFNTLWVNDDADAVRAEILRLDADIITLIEMGPSKRRIIEGLKDHYPYHADCYRIDYCNLVILSKVPIIESDARAMWKGPPFIRVKLGQEAGGLTIFGVHTIRFPHSRAQFRQVTEMADLIETYPGPKLVMGDFNATPYSRILEVLESRANLRRLTNLPSWPSQAGLPQIAIDHIFVSPGLKATESQQIGQPAGSDHFPVTLRISIPLVP